MTINKVQINIKATIDQAAREIPRSQSIREILKNSFEANATRIDIVPYLHDGAEKLAFIDDGCGMTLDQLIQCANLNVSGTEGKTSENFGWGAKVATLGWNSWVEWVSLRDDKTNRLRVFWDANGDLVTESETVPTTFWTKGQLRCLPAVKNLLKSGHGTLTILGGSLSDPSSFSSWQARTTINHDLKENVDSDGQGRTRAMVAYLSGKFLRVPCSCYYYWELPTETTEYHKRGKIHGLLDVIEENGKITNLKKWTIDSSYGRCDIYYSEGFARQANNHRIIGGKGAFLTAYKNEAYGTVLEGSKASKIFKDLGIWQSKLHRNLIVVAYPKEA